MRYHYHSTHSEANRGWSTQCKAYSVRYTYVITAVINYINQSEVESTQQYSLSVTLILCVHDTLPMKPPPLLLLTLPLPLPPPSFPAHPKEGQEGGIHTCAQLTLMRREALQFHITSTPTQLTPQLLLGESQEHSDACILSYQHVYHHRVGSPKGPVWLHGAI